MTLLQKALADMMCFHSTQKDRAGNPYFYHPLYVALRQQDETATIVGLLHDAVEDTTCTLSYIQQHYGDEIADCVDILTRKDEEKYFDYINRIKQSGNKACISVKLADLEHNMQVDRYSVPSEKDLALVKKYAKAKKILEEEI